MQCTPGLKKTLTCNGAKGNQVNQAKKHLFKFHIHRRLFDLYDSINLFLMQECFQNSQAEKLRNSVGMEEETNNNRSR